MFHIYSNKLKLMAEEGKTPKLTVKKVKLKQSGENFGLPIPQSPATIMNPSNVQLEDTSRQQQLLVNEMENFMLARAQFVQTIDSSLIDDIPEDKFLSYLEQIANGQISIQDLHTFSIEPRIKTEPYKHALTYVLKLRSKAVTMLQQLKLQQLTSNSQNELIQELAKMRSKLRSLDNMKKDELQKRLEAKESECLEYRARLGTSIQPQKTSQFEPKSLPQLEGEAQQRIAEFETGFREAHEKVLAVIKEIGELKTTVRERTVLPRQMQRIPSSTQIQQTNRGNNESQIQTIDEENKQPPDDIGSQRILPSQLSQTQLGSIPNAQNNDQLNAEITYLETLDNQAVAQLASLQEKLSAELSSLQVLETTMLQETAASKQEGARVLAKEQQIIANNRFLEAKLAETMTMKEEQNIKLKSEIVIYKNKLQDQKVKMKEALSTFETEKINEMKTQIKDAIDLKDLEIAQLNEQLEIKTKQVTRLDSQVSELTQKFAVAEQDHEAEIAAKQLYIQNLTDELKGIDHTYSDRLQQVDTIRENTQKRLNIEEQERTMNSLKLDYLVNNNKKLQLQKRFLEKTLEKDLKNLTTEMRRAEIDMQRDAFLTSQAAQQKLNNMYLIVKESLSYVKEVVQFMNFEMGDQIYARVQDDREEVNLPKRKQDQELPSPSKDEDNKVDNDNMPQQANLGSKPIEFYFQKNIYEISEILLSLICEIFQESKIQTSLDTVHLFTLIQSRTNKQLVQELYNKFFAQSKIKLIQHLSRTLTRNSTLEREKAELRRKLEEVQKIGSTAVFLPYNQTFVVNAPSGPQQPGTDATTSNIIAEPEKVSPSRQQTDSQEMSTPGRMKPDQVVQALVRFQERKIIEHQSQEMSALKQRMKEVRLHMQRQINDLQDQLHLSKEHHLAEMAKLRTEYGKDLEAIQRSQMRDRDEIRDQLDEEFRMNELEIIEDYKKLQAINEEKHREIINELIKRQEMMEIRMQEQDDELRKVKRKSLPNQQGGWGTFSVVFEDNPNKHRAITLQNGVASIQTGVLPVTNKKTTSGVSVILNELNSDHKDDSTHHHHSDGTVHYESMAKVFQLDKLQHYIEVGFTIDQRNYRFCESYKEKAYDSTLTKYLFEFIIEKFSNQDLVRYQKLIKTQLEENYGLFNEINPIYISINLGHNVSRFSEDHSLPQECFRLVRRDGHKLGNGGGELMVNFMRCDKPSLIIRVVAFDIETNHSYAFDLMYEDLMLLVEGNTKLFDPEQKYCDDLCQIILNNLTLLRRPQAKATGLKGGGAGNASEGEDDEEVDGNASGFFDDTQQMDQNEDEDASNIINGGSKKKKEKGPNMDTQPQPRVGEAALAVEHKIFLNPEYKREYDFRNDKLIKKNQVWREAYTRAVECSTDFQMSTVYESYDVIFSDYCQLGDGSAFEINLTRGFRSGNLIVKVTSANGISQELCMYQSQQSKRGETQQVASAIIQLKEPTEQGVVAYVFSFERIYSSDNLVFRVIELSKYDPVGMTSFRWDPQGKVGSSNGSIKNRELTIYLVKKNNGVYLRLQHFEVLNTEIRSLLFKHSYGYDLAIVDFGKLQTISKEATINLRNPIEGLTSSVKMKPTFDSLSVQGLNFVHRDFGILRVKTLTMIQTQPSQNSPAAHQTTPAIKEVVENPSNGEPDEEAQRVNSQGDFINDEDQELDNNDQNDNIEPDQNIDDEEFFQMENHYALFSFYDDYKCLTRGEIFFQVKIDGEFKQLTEKISGVAQLLKLTPDQFRDKMHHSSPEDKQKLCKQIFDYIVVVKSIHQSQPAEDGSVKDEVRYRAVLDVKIQPMSEVIELLKHQKQKMRADEHDLIDTEFPQVKPSLGVNLNVLAECQKQTQIQIINRKVFKVTCYFVNNLKNIKLLPLSQEKQFDWQIIYVEAETRTSTRSVCMAVTEKDLIELALQVFQRQHAGDKKLMKDTSEILSSSVSRKKLVEFIVDAIVLDEHEQVLRLSISHLLSRMSDRILLSSYFKITGGRYLPAPPQDDPEMSGFTSSIPQIEMSRRMLVNQEKEFADRKYDIRIFEVKIKHAVNETKYQFEMFAVDYPKVIFRADFLSQSQQQGKKLMVERFNIIQQLHQDFEENKYNRDGMVLAVMEQGFPHSLTFMVLEPLSHIQWQFIFTDDKLNPTENRTEKEFFVKTCKNQIEQGFWFNQMQPNPEKNAPEIPLDIVKELKTIGYQKTADSPSNQIELWTGNLRDLFIQEKVIYQKECMVKEAGPVDPELFAEIGILSDREFGTIRLVVNGRAESSFAIDTRRESSRFLSGLLAVNDQVKLFYIIQTSTGHTDQESAMRIIFQDPHTGKKLVDLVLAEKHIVETRLEKSQLTGKSFNVYRLREEVKFGFCQGFKDSFALFQKIPDIIVDFKKAFIVNEDRLRFTIVPDTSKLIYRKVIPVIHPSTQQKQTFIIFVKADDEFDSVKNQIKVILSEQSTQYEETFMFTTATVLTKDEYTMISEFVKSSNHKGIKDCISKAVDMRLKIKTMSDDLTLVSYSNQDNKLRYVAYFMEPSALAPEGPGQGAVVAATQTQLDMHKFDIRSGLRFSLVEPEKVLSDANELTVPQEKLLSQLEKEDLLFDVFEVINPFQVLLRVKTYDSDSLRVLSVSDINEAQMKEELTTDQVSFLLAEPSRRVELCKYLVANIHYDENLRKVYFLKSSLK